MGRAARMLALDYPRAPEIHVTATIIDGRAVAEQIRAELRERVGGRAE